MMFGEMPYIIDLETDEDNFDYLNDLFEEIYFKDIEERYTVLLPALLRDLTSVLCSQKQKDMT